MTTQRNATFTGTRRSLYQTLNQDMTASVCSDVTVKSIQLCSVKYDNREVAFEARFVVKTLDRKSRLFRPPAALTRVNRAEDEAAGLLRDGDRRVCPTRVYSCFVAGQQTHGRDRAAHVARHRGDDDHHHRTGTRMRCGGLEKEKGKKEKWER
ncbi:hypothetical protein F2P81_017519 [Scophthalmus maximus]|uniref:Uncharacterized protein n=1 Tax=Scophthalmus maximus TaxID=52904 RepID=A0A6A4SEY1_SCOMX|nr:hypothetical protein F2P81_017519 [Scophthalmus maximus]